MDNLRLTMLPLPPERDGWVRIRVEPFGLNRSELKLRLGLSVGVTFPRVPGIEAAGTVDAAPAGSGLAPGQKVVAMMVDMGRTFDGGYVADELHALGRQLLDRRGDVVAHERELVPARVRSAGREHAHLGGWQPEDQPTVACVDVPQSKNVAQELPGAVGVVRVDDGMRSDDHDLVSCSAR